MVTIEAYTESEAAKVLGLKVSTLRLWRSIQGGPVWFKTSKGVFYDAESINNWRNKHAKP